MAVKNIKGITIEIDGNVAPLEKALKSVNTTLRTTQKDLTDINKLLKVDPTNVELLKQKQVGTLLSL
jgi:phage-related minor tail protein